MTRRAPRDVLRALATSLRLTLRGEKPPSLVAEEQAAPVSDWCAATINQLDAIDRDLAAHPASGALTLRLDGRDIRLQTAVSVVRFHASEEYPVLLRQGGPYRAVTLQAANLDDRYAVLRFSQHPEMPASLAGKLARLAEHLAALPEIP